MAHPAVFLCLSLHLRIWEREVGIDSSDQECNFLEVSYLCLPMIPVIAKKKPVAQIGATRGTPLGSKKIKKNEIKEILAPNGRLDFFRAIVLLIRTLPTFWS